MEPHEQGCDCPECRPELYEKPEHDDDYDEGSRCAEDCGYCGRCT